MYLFFVCSYVASKIKENSNDEIKEELFKYLIDDETEFKFG